MANTIIIKNDSTTSNVPANGEMVEGELAINTTDERLWSRNSTTVFELTDHDNLTNYVANEHIDWTGATVTLQTSAGLNITGGNVDVPNIYLPDNGTIYMGDADDATILFSGVDVYYKAPVGGDHRFTMENGSETGLVITANAGVDLYYNNVSKFSTASDGVDVVGDVGATTFNTVALTGGGSATNFLNEAGGYTVPAGSGGTIGGSITDNQIAVGATTADDIEGSANLTWDAATLDIASANSASANASILIDARGDAFLDLRADRVSDAETNNAYIRFMQDGTAVEGLIGHVGAADIDPAGNTFTGMANNGLAIHSRYSANIGIGVNGAVGMTISDANAVDVVGALTATSYGGITEANLVDKTASESITGTWDFEGNLRFDDGTDVLSFSATSSTVTAQPTGGMSLMDFNINVRTNRTYSEGLYLDERASAGTDSTGDGQVWARNDPAQTLWFTPENGTDYPVGYNSMPVKTVSAAQNFLLAEVGYMMHKSSGGALTLTCATDANTWNGATWVVHNDDTEDLTIGTSGTTLYWLEAGSAPSAGNVTVEQGGIITVYKLSTTEFWCWGNKAAGGTVPTQITITDESADTTCFPMFATAATGDVAPKSGTNLTFNSSTGNLVATQIAGIANAQLVAKNAVESISGAWTFTGENTTTSGGMTYNDSVITHYGTGEDFDMYFNGTDMYMDLISGADLRIRHITEAMINCIANAQVELYHNGGLEFRTQQHEAASVTSGAEVYDHAGTLRDVGFNHVKEIAVTTVTLSNLHAGNILRKSGASSYTITMAASTTEFPTGSMCTILNHGTGGTLTISDGSEAMYIMDGSGSITDSTGFTLAVGGAITVWRQGASAFYVWGAGIP